METGLRGGLTALTQREREVVRLLAAGCTYCDIAARLGISPNTVVSHIKNSYRKLQVHNGASAVMRAMQLGLLEPLSITP
jgi:DNA-binding CsgD family transcriptional regulator